MFRFLTIFHLCDFRSCAGTSLTYDCALLDLSTKGGLQSNRTFKTESTDDSEKSPIKVLGRRIGCQLGKKRKGKWLLFSCLRRRILRATDFRYIGLCWLSSPLRHYKQMPIRFSPEILHMELVINTNMELYELNNNRIPYGDS